MHDTNLPVPQGEASASGPDLEYDPEFLALERLLEDAYSERAVGPDGEAVGPDWRAVAQQAQALAGRSQDLRVAATLTRAWLHLDGLVGLARGLALVRSLLVNHWLTVHPQIGAQGDDTGIMRITALRSLCDGRTVIAPIRAAPLVRAPGASPLCARDLEKVYSNRQPGGANADAVQVDAVFNACDVEALRGVYRAAVQARADVAAIEEAFTEHLGAAVLQLSDLAAPLERIGAQLAPRLAACEAAREAAEQPVESENEPVPEAAPESPPPPARAHTPTPAFAVESRDDVVRELERLCAYYELNEPSSPIPLLLNRAKRLAGMSFIEIIRELAPAGMAEIATLRGPITTDET
jgi:type VI secretion system protein ImpA